MTRVALGLSGGVDSAVAAVLLKEQGYEPVGVFLKMHRAGCEENAARRAAEELGIPFVIKDLTALFEERVIRPFAAFYQRGETPNPCILCNPAVKFRGLSAAADALGCAKIATGHYASVAVWGGRHLVRRVCGQEKDQSYMLYGLGEEILSRLLLPLGSFTQKSAVRGRAGAAGLSAAAKKDSLDICFLAPGQSLPAFIAQFSGVRPQPGGILGEDGTLLGTHQGICGYTVGQRRGLGVAAEQRLYVTRLDSEENTVTLGPRESCLATEVFLRGAVWHLPLPEEGLSAKVRYRDRDTPVRVELLADQRAVLHFETPKMAPAPGQSAVIYWENFVLGGGIIEKTEKNPSKKYKNSK